MHQTSREHLGKVAGNVNGTGDSGQGSEKISIVSEKKKTCFCEQKAARSLTGKVLLGCKVETRRTLSGPRKKEVPFVRWQRTGKLLEGKQNLHISYSFFTVTNHWQKPCRGMKVYFGSQFQNIRMQKACYSSQK